MSFGQFIRRKAKFIFLCHSDERSEEESQNAVMLFRSEILRQSLRMTERNELACAVNCGIRRMNCACAHELPRGGMNDSYPIYSLNPIYLRRTSGMRIVPSACRLFSKNAISMRGGATTVLFSVCAK